MSVKSGRTALRGYLPRAPKLNFPSEHRDAVEDTR